MSSLKYFNYLTNDKHSNYELSPAQVGTLMPCTAITAVNSSVKKETKQSTRLVTLGV